MLTQSFIFFFNVESSCSHVINLVTGDDMAQWVKGAWHQTWPPGFVPKGTCDVWKETTSQAVLWQQTLKRRSTNTLPAATAKPKSNRN